MNSWTMRFAGLVLCAALAAGLLPARGSADPVKVTFVLVSDLDSIEIGETRGGFARLAGLVARERAAHPNVLFLHAGDALSPSLLAGFDHGRHVVELLNMIGLDAFTPGNHEFDFGPTVFRERIAEAEFPVLAANLGEADGVPIPGIGASRMFEFDGVNIGVVGITSHEAHVKASPGDLHFSDMVEALEAEATRLRDEGADIIVALAHANRSEDAELVRSRIADVILSGDDHDLTVFFDGRTVHAESMAQAEVVVVVDLMVDIGERDGVRTVKWFPHFRVVDTAGVEPDPAVATRISELHKQLSSELDASVGQTVIELDSRRASVRTGEAAIGNLIADAMRVATGADVALTNGGGIRGNTVYAAGATLKRRDILSELPFGNKSVVVELTGAQLRAALENGVSDIDNAGGRFPQVSGLAFEADLSQPPGQRVVAIEVGGAPLDDGRTYRVATNDFMLRGGDGYVVFGEGNIVIDAQHGNLMVSEVMAYVRARGTETAAVSGRVKLRRGE